MKIRDSFAVINGNNTQTEMPSGGLEIISDDGRTLFGINLNKDGSLRVDAGHFCKHGGVILNDRLQVSPVAANVVVITRKEEKAL